jgi:hypothetical protein
MDAVQAKVFFHPLRVRLLGAIGFRPASATDLACSLFLPLDKVCYHVAVLYNMGYIVPLEGHEDLPDPVYEPARRI